VGFFTVENIPDEILLSFLAECPQINAQRLDLIILLPSLLNMSNRSNYGQEQDFESKALQLRRCD